MSAEESGRPLGFEDCSGCVYVADRFKGAREEFTLGTLTVSTVHVFAASVLLFDVQTGVQSKYAGRISPESIAWMHPTFFNVLKNVSLEGAQLKEWLDGTDIFQNKLLFFPVHVPASDFWCLILVLHLDNFRSIWQPATTPGPCDPRIVFITSAGDHKGYEDQCLDFLYAFIMHQYQQKGFNASACWSREDVEKGLPVHVPDIQLDCNAGETCSVLFMLHYFARIIHNTEGFLDKVMNLENPLSRAYSRDDVMSIWEDVEERFTRFERLWSRSRGAHGDWCEGFARSLRTASFVRAATITTMERAAAPKNVLNFVRRLNGSRKPGDPNPERSILVEESGHEQSIPCKKRKVVPTTIMAVKEETEVRPWL